MWQLSVPRAVPWVGEFQPFGLGPRRPCVDTASNGGDIGCRHTPEMIEMCQKTLDLQAKEIVKF